MELVIGLVVELLLLVAGGERSIIISGVIGELLVRCYQSKLPRMEPGAAKYLSRK
jgi:hypothetical protein